MPFTSTLHHTIIENLDFIFQRDIEFFLRGETIDVEKLTKRNLQKEEEGNKRIKEDKKINKKKEFLEGTT